MTPRPWFRKICLLLLVVPLLSWGCGPKKPDDDSLARNPAAKAAINGLANSYSQTSMWEFRDPAVLAVQVIVPTKGFVQEYDPMELYCVCVEFDLRYRVPWASVDRSDWERQVRNVLVMKNQGDHYLAMKQMDLCPIFCK
ncbi:MAG: hypothetical protein V1816_07275 [Pseudomonadota bacterium]